MSIIIRKSGRSKADVVDDDGGGGSGVRVAARREDENVCMCARVR